VINEYRRTVGAGVDGANPITAVRSVDIAFAVGGDAEEEGDPELILGPYEHT
jgi:hypothetical protein